MDKAREAREPYLAYPRARFRHTPSFVGMHYSDDLIILDVTLIEDRPPETRLALLKNINTRAAAEAKISPDDLMITIYEAPGGPRGCLGCNHWWEFLSGDRRQLPLRQATSITAHRAVNQT